MTHKPFIGNGEKIGTLKASIFNGRNGIGGWKTLKSCWKLQHDAELLKE